MNSWQIIDFINEGTASVSAVAEMMTYQVSIDRMNEQKSEC